jgi:predicted negative regulator of RcsB-dependent stress response
MTPQQTIETEPTRTQSFPEWIQANSRAVGIGAVVVLVAGAGYWFYLRSAEIKRLNAERGLSQAKQSLNAGNAGLAQTDLQRVASRYKGTPAGSQAAMLLAKLEYDQGKYAEGIKALEPYQTASAAGPNLAPVWALTADGQLALGQAAAAASSYQKAAEATSLPGERSMYWAKAARAFMTAGKDADARAIWERLSTDPDAVAVKNEAEIRLGELSAKSAGRS